MNRKARVDQEPVPNGRLHRAWGPGSVSRVVLQKSAREGEAKSAMGALFAVASPAIVGFAYLGTGELPLFLLGALLVAALRSDAGRMRLRAPDWSMLQVLAYNVISMPLSRYSPASSRAAMTVCVAVLLYFLVRLTVLSLQQAVLTAAVVGIGGAVLAVSALVQFNEQIRLLKASGFMEVVAFRARLITPPAPWILGEWYTLLLLTLPFAFTVSVVLGGRQRPILSACSLPLPVVIIAGLLLSCSRAVLWAVVVSAVLAAGMAGMCRVIPTKVMAIAIATTLGVLGAVLTSENLFYPGLAEAYAGQHASQVRSTEGRLAIWKRSADVFKLSPIWGVGEGNAPLFLTSDPNQEETTGFASRTFSLPIQVLTEKGLVGAALYLVVLVLAGCEAHRKLRSPKVSAQIKGLTCCLVAGVIAVLFRELTYSSLLEHAATAMLFATSLALLAAEEPA